MGSDLLPLHVVLAILETADVEDALTDMDIISVRLVGRCTILAKMITDFTVADSKFSY